MKKSRELKVKLLLGGEGQPRKVVIYFDCPDDVGEQEAARGATLVDLDWVPYGGFRN